MIHAGAGLARRLEGLVRAECFCLAEVARTLLPGVPVECIQVDSGAALWLGEGSPVNLAVALGMDGPVEEAELQRVETFYRGRGARPAISICPLAHPSLLEGLGRRGWYASDFEHVLVLEMGENWCGGGVQPPMGLEIRVCAPEERQLWGRLAAQGFSTGESSEPGHQDFGAIMAARDDAILVLAWVDGTAAGTGALTTAGGVGWLFGDTTVPQYRSRGIQQALQRHRLSLAQAAGCELAVTEAAPGGVSQRNMERVGFQIAYTRVEFVKE